jgi:hypothetical protein
MGEAIRNILVKFEQQQKMDQQFYGRQVFDAVCISEVPDKLDYNHPQLFE